MRRILALGIACVLLLCLCACGKKKDADAHSHETTAASAVTTVTTGGTGHTDASTVNDIIRFNKPKDYTHVGRSLADPTTVSKETFAADYDIRWTGMFDGEDYQTEYILYHYTEDATQTMGLSGLCYGLIRVTKEEQVVMVMWVSTSGYAGSVAYPDADSVPSRIRGNQVYLVDASKTKNPSMYAQFQWGKNYVTCQLYDCEQNDLVNFVRSLLANTPR